MRAYQRADGSYDVYDVEPQVMTAAEYAKVKRRKELTASKESHLAAIAAIDQELKELSAPTAGSTVDTTTTVAAGDFKRKW